MPWPNPPTTSRVPCNWADLFQYFSAARERLNATPGGQHGIRMAWIYDTFTITSIVDNGDGTYTLTDSGKPSDPNWALTSGWPVSPARWVTWDASGTGTPWAESSYDVVIDAPCASEGPDPRKVIQAPITASTVDTVTVTGLAERVTERTCASIASLVGRRCFIVKRNGVNWTRGYPQWPNDVVYASGIVADAVAGHLDSDRGLNHTPLTGKDVLYRDVSDVLQRGRITASANGLDYTGTTGIADVDGAFFVVDADGYFQWGRKGGVFMSFYGGSTEGYLGHSPHDDTLQTVGMPLLSVDLSLGTVAGFCPSPSSYPIFDLDFWLDQDEVCAGASDEPLNPDIWRTLRGLWNLYIQLCVYFVDPARSLEGGVSIPLFTVAQWFAAAGINSQTTAAGTYDNINTRMPVSLTVPFTPYDVWFACVDTHGNVLASGVGTYDGTYLVGGGLSDACNGMTIIVSLGPTRYVPRRFARLYDVNFFLPADHFGFLVIPPSDVDPGQWNIRAKSDHYLAASTTGFVADSEHAIDAFANGDLARYVGENFYDPGLNPNFTSDSTDPLIPYYDYAHTGTRAKATQSAIDASKSGRASSGSTRHLTDADKDWLSVDFYPASNGLTHTGTGGGGSSTTQLVDASKAGTGLWASARFPGFSGPLVGFTVEFLISGSDFDDPNAVIEKRIVSSGDGTTGTLGWDEALSVSADGLAYQIVEPMILNRWAGRKLKLSGTTADPTLTDTVTITGNDGDTLFFPAASFTVDEGTSYSIIDPRCGRVMRRVSGAWTDTAPTEIDARAPNPNFKSDPNNNLEDHVVRYGLPLPMDVTPDFFVFWNQLYTAIKLLWKTRHDINWTNDPGTGPEDNSKSITAGNEEDWPQGGWTSGTVSGNYDTSFCEFEYLADGNTFPTDEQSWDHLINIAINGAAGGSSIDAHGCEAFDAPYSFIAGGWTSLGYVGTTAVPVDGTAPYCYASAFLNGQGATATAARAYSYAKTNIPQGDCPTSRTVKFYAYTQIDADDHDDGNYCVEDPSGTFTWYMYHFNAEGDGVLFRQFHQWDSQATAATAVVSHSLGLNDLTDAPVAPAWVAPSGCTGRRKVGLTGYLVTQAYAVAEWDFYYR